MTKHEEKRLLMRADKHHQQYRKLHAKVEKAREKRILPKLRRQYKGKYFKYDNGINDETRWPIFIYVHDVLDRNKVIADTFEVDYEGKCEYMTDGHLYTDFLQTEIEESEYMEAMVNFIAGCQQLSSNQVNKDGQ